MAGKEQIVNQADQISEDNGSKAGDDTETQRNQREPSERQWPALLAVDSPDGRFLCHYSDRLSRFKACPTGVSCQRIRDEDSRGMHARGRPRKDDSAAGSRRRVALTEMGAR
jgi:hypothetical protein